MSPQKIHRRGFLGSVASGTFARGRGRRQAGPADAAAPGDRLPRPHLQRRRDGYPPIEKPYRPPAGKGTVAHLRREMKANGVAHVTAIQTSTFYRWDNRFLADSAQRTPRLHGRRLHARPRRPCEPRICSNSMCASRTSAGMRSIPAKSGRLDDPGSTRSWATAERLGIVINVLAGRDKADEIEALARRHPSLRVVIDHCLNLKAGAELEPTLEAPRTARPAAEGCTPS